MNKLGNPAGNQLCALLPIVALALLFSQDFRFNAQAAESSATNQLLDLPSHPYLLLNPEGISQFKKRVAEVSWAKASWADLKTAAGKSLDRPVELPPRGGNWSHNYVCPTHSARLSQGKQIGPWQWEHICPVGRHVLHGDPSKAALDFDGNAIAGAHGNYAQQVINDGLVYQVTGDDRYARKAREILLAYADRYLSYPLHDNQGKQGRGGHVASQSLTEASWLIDIAQGVDLVWTTLSEVDRQAIAEKLLRPAVEQVILPSRLGIHNIQCRHNSAIGVVGLLLGDQKLISIAIDDPARGFRQQIEKGVRDDGMWIEGSSGYHYFTIAGLWPLAEAARNCGRNLYNAKFQSMFDGPLSLAMPNFVLPNFNDSGTVPLENESDLYELAFARFHNPAYALLLANSGRHGHLALLYGDPTLPTSSPSAISASRNSTASGYAILQRGANQDATWLCVKYGPHGGGHGHPDKNTFILYAHGQMLALDAGTHAYGSPLHHDWDKTTFAHNTLVMDQISQEPATGKSLAFGTEKGIEYSITDAGPVYKGVQFIRTVAMLSPETILFVDQVQADAPHTFDLVYHQMGTWDEDPHASSGNRYLWSPPAAPGYSHVSQSFVRTNSGDNLRLSIKADSNWHPSLTLNGAEPTEIITGYGVMKTTEDLVPLLLQRRHTRQTAFIWALSLDGGALTLKTSQATDAAGKPFAAAEVACVEVGTADGRHWSLLVNPRRDSIQVRRSDGSVWRSQALFAAE